MKSSLGSNDGGADGMAFVLQNLDTGQGSTGGGLGYGGGAPISPSMAIEFDTWYNGGTDPAAVAPPSTDDHIAFVENGNTSTMPLAADITIVDNQKTVITIGCDFLESRHTGLRL